MFMLNSSIGKKFVQAVSGAFLILFLLLHGTINFFSVIDSFTGKFGAPDGLFMKGCEFMALPIVDIMVPILALGFVIHIGFGIWLTVENVRARGGVKRYEVASKGAADSWSARNMAVLGVMVLGFLFFHLAHFWAKMQLQDFTGGEAENPYMLLLQTFGNPWILGGYIVWFVAIFLHLAHGFWSMFQTIGWNGGKWFGRLKVISVIVAALIILLFVASAANAFLQDNFIQPDLLDALKAAAVPAV
ncbi:MAG: succinate dehydrogenase cytochrome b subunit [Bacteroidales bacterium]|nr:succinate dehydrogenase cytochrome b subunit [Bacteroidales bacterium]